MRDKSNLDQIFQTYLETYYFTKGTLWTKKKLVQNNIVMNFPTSCENIGILVNYVASKPYTKDIGLAGIVTL